MLKVFSALLHADLPSLGRKFMPPGKQRPLPVIQSNKITVNALPGDPDSRVFEPTGGARRSMVFLHGFSSKPDDMRSTCMELALQGQVRVEAPKLPVLSLANAVSYHDKLREAALTAYDDAAARAKELGLPPPVVAGVSMGGGVALYVAAQRHVPAVLWAPFKLTGSVPVSDREVLVIQGGADQVVKDMPAELARVQPRGTLTVMDHATHSFYVDSDQYDFSESACRNNPLTPDAQRMQAIAQTVSFLKWDGSASPRDTFERSGGQRR